MDKFLWLLEEFITSADLRYPYQDQSIKELFIFLNRNKNREKMTTKLFKKTKSGRIQEWSIELFENRYRTHEGLMDGAITASKWTVVDEGKNLGKSNATTPEQQAALQVESLITSKLESGYYRSVNEVDKGVQYFEPMLAHKWEGQINHITISQPKLDGMRCIATPEGLFSRNGKPIVGAPHIWDDINNSGIWMEHPDLVIDGELYNHELKNDFNKIISCVRKTKPTYEDLLESEKNIQYHVYDCKVLRQPELGFGGRFTFLYELMLRLQPKFLRIVKTNVIGHQTCIDDPTPEEHIDTLYGLYLEQGYEGQMIRFDEPYENKRSKNLLKRKEFITEEFEILDVEEGIGNRSGMMGRIHFQTAEGRPFTASSRGNEDYYRDLLSNKETYIGKMATVRYQNMTPDGSPRFPVVITVRDYE